jgi:hypothetical protein
MMPRSSRLGASIAQRRGPRRSLNLLCERLESRDLMSNTPFSSLIFQAPPAKNPPLSPRIISSELPKNVSGRIEGLYELSLTKHPLYQGNVVGHVVKAPMFNPGYTGPKRLDLDVIGTRANKSSQQGVQLTGEVLGPIDPAKLSIYSFLIARGSTQGRPTSSFDLKVSVTDGPGGPVGVASLLDSQQQATSTVSLPPGSVRVNGNTVQATVPTGLLPSTTSPRRRLAVPSNFYIFEAAVPGGQPTDIAGFAPGYMTT